MAIFNIAPKGKVTDPLQAKLLGAFGKILTSVGTAVHAPQILPGGLGATLQSSAGDYLSKMNPITPPQVKGAESTVNWQIPKEGDTAPDGSVYRNGQWVSPSGGGGGGGGFLSGGQPIDTGGSQDLGLVNAGWEEARRAIEGQNPILDQSYALSKGDIERGITSAETSGQTQTEGLNKRYGDILANQLRTYQDLGRQRQGVFSSLGTLESSAFGEQQARADQSLAEGKTQTELNKSADIKSVQDTVNSYKQQANSELARLGLQYQQGKQAISTALANNDIQAAASIKDTIDQIRNRALTIQSLLSGTLSSIGGVTGENYASNVAKQLASVTSSGNAQYTLPATTDEGQGFVAPDGKRYKNYLEYLNSFGQATL